MDEDGKKTRPRRPRCGVNNGRSDSRLRVLGAAGLSSGFASSHVDGFGFVWWGKMG